MIIPSIARDMYLSRKTLRELGEQFGGVSRQRVLQVLKAIGVPLRGHPKKERLCRGCRKLIAYSSMGAGGRVWCSISCSMEFRRSSWDKGFSRLIRKTRGCWIWIGDQFHPYGYGEFHGKYAHRESWRIFVGPIPHGLWVLHSCDNPGCVRPSHLWLGTSLDNNADRDAKGRTGEIDGRLVYPCSEKTVRYAVTSKTAKSYGVDPPFLAEREAQAS